MELSTQTRFTNYILIVSLGESNHPHLTSCSTPPHPPFIPSITINHMHTHQEMRNHSPLHLRHHPLLSLRTPPHLATKIQHDHLAVFVHPIWHHPQYLLPGFLCVLSVYECTCKCVTLSFLSLYMDYMDSASPSPLFPHLIFIIQALTTSSDSNSDSDSDGVHCRVVKQSM